MAPKNQSREARERLRLYQARQGLHERQRRRRVRDDVVWAGALVLVAALATGSQLVYAATQDDDRATASASATGTATPHAVTQRDRGGHR
ncbi:hypothetical protein [Curtobacterium sp. MCJR17_043]|uniref:hypothetical protein n=1 Tax=Curtobacterium sp. MCJR17_043 TaxID=2175660 RepID=UPI0024DF8601|nr:hypothetical protein [Curtobacterium sp. MCJR17_043]WIB35099.1 hypothetical protein DEJ15_11680 [Curtobacterium sp. MCJR17_043]